MYPPGLDFRIHAAFANKIADRLTAKTAAIISLAASLSAYIWMAANESQAIIALLFSLLCTFPFAFLYYALVARFKLFVLVVATGGIFFSSVITPYGLQLIASSRLEQCI